MDAMPERIQRRGLKGLGMGVPSPTFPSLFASCLAASPQGGAWEYLTGEVKVGCSKKQIILLEAPKLGSPGLSSTCFHQQKWGSGPRGMNPGGQPRYSPCHPKPLMRAPSPLL